MYTPILYVLWEWGQDPTMIYAYGDKKKANKRLASLREKFPSGKFKIVMYYNDDVEVALKELLDRVKGR